MTGRTSSDSRVRHSECCAELEGEVVPREPSDSSGSESETPEPADPHESRAPKLLWGAPRRYWVMLAVCYSVLLANIAVFTWAATALADSPTELALWGVALIALNPFVWLLLILIRNWHVQIGRVRREPQPARSD